MGALDGSAPCAKCGKPGGAWVTHVCLPVQTPPDNEWTPTFESVSPKDPIRLPDLVRRALAYPRFLSIGALENTVEVRMTRELYEEIRAIISGEATSVGR